MWEQPRDSSRVAAYPRNMNRTLRQALIFFALLLVFTLARMPYDVLFPNFIENLKAAARESRIPLSIGSSDASFPARVELSQVAAQIPLQGAAFSVPIAIDSASLRVHPLSLLILRAVTDLELKGYGGTITGTIGSPFSGGAIDGELRIQNLSIGAHPLSSLIGVTGLLSGTFTGLLSVIDPTQTDGTIELKISSGTYAGGHTVYIMKLPPISDISAAISGTVKGFAVRMSTATVRCSLGEASAKGSLELIPANRPGSTGLSVLPFKNLKLEGTLRLSDEGKKLFGGYLALGAKLPVDRGTTVQSWKFDAVQDGREIPRVAVREG